MTVRVRLFAVARQLAGDDSVSLDLPEGAAVAQLRQELGRRFPQLSGVLPRVLFAVDAKYADDRTPLSPDSEVACIPPVSGG